MAQLYNDEVAYADGTVPYNGDPPAPPQDTYYLPPTFPYRQKKKRLDLVGAPDSKAWRSFTDTNRTPDEHPSLLIDGVSYLGGRWNGPLSGAEIAAITAAGYASRLVEAADPNDLPGGLDP